MTAPPLPAPAKRLQAPLAWLAAPFDALRHQFAATARAGIAPRSLIASGQFERATHLLETLMLGPLARRR